MSAYQRRVLAAFPTMLRAVGRRCHWITHGADPMVTVVLFFTLFLPLDRCWTVDIAVARWRGDKLESKQQHHALVSNQASAALVSVVTQMYLHNWLCKARGIAWAEENTAVELAMSATSLVSGWGVLLGEQRLLCRFLTKMTMLIEGPVPVLASIVPLAPVRFLCVLQLILLHASFVVFFRLGSFPLICMCPLVAMLPSETWDVLLGLVAVSDGQAVMTESTPEFVKPPSNRAEKLPATPSRSVTSVSISAPRGDSESEGAQWLLLYWLATVLVHGASLTGLTCGFSCSFSAEMNLEQWPRGSAFISEYLCIQ